MDISYENVVISISTNINDEDNDIEYDICERVSKNLTLNDTTKNDIDELLSRCNNVAKLILNTIKHIEDCAVAYNATYPNTKIIDVHLFAFEDKYDFIHEARRLDIDYGSEYYPDGDEYYMIIVDLYNEVNGSMLWIETFVNNRYYGGSSTTIYQNFQYTRDEY